MRTRCKWAIGSELEAHYHDHEWGTPLFDENKLFEFLILEGAQAGLSWVTVLRKREAYRAAYDNFDPEKVASFTTQKAEELQQNSGIIRNRLKIASSIKNAQAFLKIQEEFGSFSCFYWQFSDGKPIINHWKNREAVPAETELSNQLSKELKSRGFNFVGPTICYAFMQATGMINDHTIDCFRHSELII
jgi:DNA-3-methyladenine glycosylase I